MPARTQVELHSRDAPQLPSIDIPRKESNNKSGGDEELAKKLPTLYNESIIQTPSNTSHRIRAIAETVIEVPNFIMV